MLQPLQPFNPPSPFSPYWIFHTELTSNAVMTSLFLSPYTPHAPKSVPAPSTRMEQVSARPSLRLSHFPLLILQILHEVIQVELPLPLLLLPVLLILQHWLGQLILDLKHSIRTQV